MIAEDNLDHAELIADALYDCSPQHKITHLIDGAALLEKLSDADPQDLPDLILLDLKMPRLNGVNTLKKLKSSPSLQHVPVMILTTSCTDYEKRVCLALGATQFITKPIDSTTMASYLCSLSLSPW
jgi:Response regulators consisting of a CheY-like receiver domain and a winged-helix DNA-binding domain